MSKGGHRKWSKIASFKSGELNQVAVRRGFDGKQVIDAGRDEGGAAKEASLKFLKLVKEDGTPEPALRNLVDASGVDKKEAYKQVLTGVLKSAYPALFEAEFDLPNVGPAQFKEKFEELGVSGETVRKSEKFFLDAAEDAGLRVSPLVLDARKKSPKVGRTSTPAKGKRKGSPSVGEQTGGSIAAEVDPVKQAMLDKFPEFNPEWDAQVQEKWFDMYGRLLKIAENDEE